MAADLAKSIAIIGGGFFGCAIATKLSAHGYECTIYEKRDRILGGTASRNVLRIHKGPHYPRSKETALQCLEGYNKFCNNFSECIETSFSNYYVISSEHSKTTFDNFVDFCSCLNIEHVVIPKTECQKFFTNCDGGIICEEGTINVFRMLAHYEKVLAENACEVLTNKEIIRIDRNGDRIVLKTNVENYEADIVINCSFTEMNLGLGTLHHASNELVYQKTVCFKCKTSDPVFGLTVLDGESPTIFPSFWDEHSTELDSFMLYHVTHSVCREQISVRYPEFEPITHKELQERYDLTLSEIQKFLPNIKEIIGETEFLVADRIIRPHVKDTDTRISEIIKMAENCYVIFQGKIDYSLNIADQMLELLREPPFTPIKPSCQAPT
tara:strand:+ start:1807 stop:2952 length:1146 start_codon:yes stop_codon:yes gene_type:complete